MPGDAMTDVFRSLVKEEPVRTISGVIIDAQERL